MYFAHFIFFLGLVGVTTLVSFAAVKKVQPASARSIGPAIRAFVDWAGMFAIFFAANVALATAVILLIRGITSYFVSIYMIDDIHLIVLSAVQAFVFQKWWKGE
jgi:hypothetical protein